MEMPYSLADRFRGALLGAALGELFGAQNPPCGAIARDERWTVAGHQAQTARPEAATSPGWGAYAVRLTERLMQPPTPAEKPSTDAALIPWPAGAAAWGVGGWAIATLPLILYYHDDFARLSDRLRQSLAALGLAPSEEDDSVAVLQVWGGCLSLALHGDRPSVAWLGRLSLELDLPQRSPHLAQQLAQVQDWLAGNAPSAQLERSRSEAAIGNPEPSQAIALALYSVLATPDSVRLSLAQAAVLGDLSSDASATVCALTGALAGSVNSIRGIPLQWRQWRQLQEQQLQEQQLQRRQELWADPTATSPVAKRWGLPSEAALLALADRLAAHWSGLYDLESPIEPRAIALAPDLIRPRPARISV